MEATLLAVPNVLQQPTAVEPLPATLPNTHNLSPLKDRVVSLLGQGIKPSMVAISTGVEPGYITQLLEDPNIAEQVAQLKAKTLEKDVKHDATIEEVEALALKKVKDNLPLVKSPLEAARIFVMMNTAKKRTQDNSGDNVNNGVVVNLILPAAAREQLFKINSARQVTEVDGRTLAPLPSRELHKLGSAAKSATPTLMPPSDLDKNVAVAKLDGLQDMEVMIDGVRVVL